MKKKSITLLIVDDEPEIREGLSNVVDWEEHGIELVGTSKDGADAYTTIHKFCPNLVITDIKMPIMDGLTLVQKVTEEKLPCKFIILSGFADFDYAQKAIQYQVREYLLKPIVLNELLLAVSRVSKEILLKRTIDVENTTNLASLQKARTAARKQLIPELLYQGMPEGELLHILDEFSLPISNTSSCVVLLKYHALSSESEADDESSENDFSAYSDYTVLKKGLEGELDGLPILCSSIGNNTIAMICNLPFQSKGFSCLEDFLSDFINRASKKLPLEIHAAIGSTAPSLTALSTSYKSASKALLWCIYDCIPVIITTKVLQGNNAMPDPPKDLPYEEIFNAIMQGDENQTSDLIKQFFSILLYKPTPPPNYLFSMCNYLLIDMNRRIVKCTGMPLQCYPGDSYQILLNLGRLETIEQWVNSILLEFIAELRVRSIRQTDPIIESAMEYIHKNIFKKVHIEDICTHVGLSKSYFTTYFKNKTHLNFRDYILDLKISYATEHLKTAKHSPSELAIMLGYENYRSFNRAFKARTGSTPSEYQQKYLLNKR